MIEFQSFDFNFNKLSLCGAFDCRSEINFPMGNNPRGTLN